MSLVGMQTPFGPEEWVVVSSSDNRARRARHHYFVGRLARAFFVAIILVLVLPMLMILFFNLQAPELYPYRTACEAVVRDHCVGWKW